MKSFKFSLEAVLDWRAGQVEAAEMQLSRSVAERQRVEAGLSDLLERRSQAEREARSMPGLDSVDLASLAAFLGKCLRDENAIRRHLAGCERNVLEQRTRLMELRRARQLLEKLKDNQRARWSYAMNRELESLADESCLAGIARRLSSR